MNKPVSFACGVSKPSLKPRTLAFSLLMSVLVDAQATSIDIAGSYTTGDVNINSTLGTNGTVEASVKLKASGPITYNYAFQFDLDVDTSAFIGPGDTFTATPFLANTQASLNASQNVNYTNDFTFLLDVPDGLPGIPNQVGFSNITIPRFEIQDQGFAYLKGDGSLNSTGNTFTENYLGRGYVTANGDFQGTDNSIAAWRAGGVDIFDIALLAAGLPPLPGFELYPTAGIDILRKDQAWLADYEFTDPLQFTIPDNLNIGDVFNFSVDTNLKYDLGFYSFFAYEGNLLLEFDIPDWIPGLPEAYDIKLANLGKWDVAVVTSELDDLLLPVTISGSVTLGEVPEVCERFIGTQFYMSCLLHVREQEPLDEAMRQPPEYPMPVGDRTFEVAEVPEPNGLALLAIGLLGMAWMRRRQLQTRAIAATFAGMAALGLSAGVQAVPISADIVVLVDESVSMAGRHAWLSSITGSLEPQLYNAGVTGPNHYGLIGFNSDDAVANHGISGSASTGINDGYAHLHSLHPGSPSTYYGTATEFSTGVGGLITSGSVGVNTPDGAYAYKAINYALGSGGAVGQLWRSGSAHNLILVTDWNKEDSDSTSYVPVGTRDALLNTNTILNAVIDVDILCGDGTTAAMGVDATGTGYVANANGAYTTCTGAYVVEAPDIIWSYADLALAVGGAVWDLSILDDGIFEYTMDFTQAFVDVKVGEITDTDDEDNGSNGGDNGNQGGSVPEPASLALLGIGLAGLGISRRKRI